MPRAKLFIVLSVVALLAPASHAAAREPLDGPEARREAASYLRDWAYLFRAPERRLTACTMVSLFRWDCGARFRSTVGATPERCRATLRVVRDRRLRFVPDVNVVGQRCGYKAGRPDGAGRAERAARGGLSRWLSIIDGREGEVGGCGPVSKTKWRCRASWEDYDEVYEVQETCTAPVAVSLFKYVGDFGYVLHSKERCETTFQANTGLDRFPDVDVPYY